MYDARALRADLRKMVREARAARSLPDGPMWLIGPVMPNVSPTNEAHAHQAIADLLTYLKENIHVSHP